MNRPWEPERVVDLDMARSLIEERFPELRPGRIESFGVGWDNTVYLVDGTWVFRFPRRRMAAELIDAECAVLPAIASRLPLEVPLPIWSGRCEERFPWTFAGYRMIRGRTACRADLDEGQRMRSAAPLGSFLAALHGISEEEMRERGAEGDELKRLHLEHRIPMAEERFGEICRLGLVEDPGLCEEVVGGLPEEWEPSTSTLVHGDLYARHLLVDEHARPCGVIDWGDVHLGDPALDLSIAWAFLPPSARDAFRDAYGPIDDDTWLVARFRALFSVIMELVYGHDVGDEALVREGRAALTHLRS